MVLVGVLATVAAVAAWLWVGHRGFVYWWTHDYDLSTGANAFGWFVGIAGPLTWLIGWVLHGDPDRVLVKKRR